MKSLRDVYFESSSTIPGNFPTLYTAITKLRTLGERTFGFQLDDIDGFLYCPAMAEPMGDEPLEPLRR